VNHQGALVRRSTARPCKASHQIARLGGRDPLPRPGGRLSTGSRTQAFAADDLVPAPPRAGRRVEDRAGAQCLTKGAGGAVGPAEVDAVPGMLSLPLAARQWGRRAWRGTDSRRWTRRRPAPWRASRPPDRSSCDRPCAAPRRRRSPGCRCTGRRCFYSLRGSKRRLILNSLRPTPCASYQCTSASITYPSGERCHLLPGDISHAKGANDQTGQRSWQERLRGGWRRAPSVSPCAARELARQE
jgi:hypothetical protein